MWKVSDAGSSLEDKSLLYKSERGRKDRDDRGVGGVSFFWELKHKHTSEVESDLAKRPTLQSSTRPLELPTQHSTTRMNLFGKAKAKPQATDTTSTILKLRETLDSLDKR